MEKFAINREKGLLKLNDPIRGILVIIYFVLPINILNSVIFSYNSNKDESTLQFFWICIAVLSVGILIYFSLKRSVKKEYQLSQIKAIRKKKSFGRDLFFLKLHNGRSRFIQMELSDFEQLKTALEEAGCTFESE